METIFKVEEEMKIMTRRFAFLVLSAAFIALGGAAFASASQGQISYMEGQVTIDNVAASIGDVVPLGATVRTDSASLCEIIFRERNILRLGADTAFVYNPANLQVGCELQKGDLTLVLKNLVTGAGSSHSFFVRTPSTAAGVRGTSFYMKVEDPHTTYVCICNGAISLDNGAGPSGMNIEAPHHLSFHLAENAGAVTVTPSPELLYHTDQDMANLAAKIGVTIDWTTIDRNTPAQ
jgi:hypothetical protein